MDASGGITLTKDGLWQDVTDEFKHLVSHLNLGELLQSDHCTLFEAMSAIELMDPKMDSGMSLKKCNRKILNFDQAIKSGQIKINDFETNELLGIIDETYLCLVSWFDGYHLAQTVMTNLYLHRPEKIGDRCLRIFSQTALKLTKFIDNMICEILCVEEEDFVLNMCRFNIDLEVTDQKVLNSLEDLCNHYEKLLIDSKQNPNQKAQNNTINSSQCTTNGTEFAADGNSKRQDNHHQTNSSDGSSQAKTTEKTLDSSHLGALISRLRFSYHFFACFFHIHRNILKDSHTMAEFENQTDAQISKSIKLVQSASSVCDQHLEKCLRYLDKWNETIDLGIKPGPMNDENSSDWNYPTIMGFEPLLNLKLVPANYPRCPSLRSRPSSLVYLRDLITRMRECISISGNFYQKSLVKSLNLIESFSKYSRPNSCVISRSFLQALYLPGLSAKLLKRDLVQSMLEYCEPLGQLMRGDEEPKSQQSPPNPNVFLDYCQKSFSQLVHVYGHNPSRQYERFSVELIASFKNLQYESAFVNSMAYSWTTYHLVRLCIKYVLSGLELDLFSAHEYPYVFWYLYEILYINEREQLELARQFMESQTLAEDAQRKAKGKKNRRKQSKTSFHESQLLCNDAYRFLTGGIFLLTHGLKLQGKIRTPSMAFTSEEIYFEHRFGALTGTSVYQSYRLTLDKLHELQHIYREALHCFSEAKEIFSVINTEHEGCLKVCKANMVVTRILSSNLESFKDREVEFNFDLHPNFPTVKFLSE